jgi:hypothetical protein
MIGRTIQAIDPALPPIFSLKHLAQLSDVDYGLLRSIASRSLKDPYRKFRIRKRAAFAGEIRFRLICVPDPGLMRVQRWIAQNILRTGRPHPASVAYALGNNIVDAAEPHCGCRWLIKLDIQNFFESITEIAAFRVFRSFGYEPLVAFELARLSTRKGTQTPIRSTPRWRSFVESRSEIAAYRSERMGHLPQGAPTSPMLANLAVREFDGEVETIADREGLTYTRYADDLVLSTSSSNFSRGDASRIVGSVYEAMGRVGLSPNVTKTQVATPGSRKLVLGLLVDGPKPRLNREFRSTMRRHLHYLSRADIGPARHAKARGFSSIAGLKHHVHGLISFARQVEPDYGQECAEQFRTIVWPI